MMTEPQFSDWCARIGLTPEGIELLRLIRSTPPSRASKGYTGNVRGFYPSVKMDHTAQFDSRTCELPKIYDLEHDDSVIEFWEQPAPIKLSWVNQDGRNCSVSHIADFAVLYKDEAVFMECKPEELLVKGAAKNPCMFTKDGEVWRRPPAEARLAALGIRYVVWTPEAHQTYARNMNFLQDYYIRECPPVPPEIEAEVKTILAARRRVRLDELSILVKGITADHLNLLILQRRIFVDLWNDALPMPFKVWVYEDRETAASLGAALDNIRAPEHTGPIPVTEESGASIKWDGKVMTLKVLTPTMVYVQDGGAPLIHLKRIEFDGLVVSGAIQGTTPTGEHPVVEEVRGKLLCASTKHIQQAQANLTAIHGGPSHLSARQLRRLKKNAKRAAEALGVSS